MRTGYKSMVACSFIIILSGLYMLGCNLVTVPNQQTGTGNTANHVVINEVFTLPDSQYDAYSWVELYNPTGQHIIGLHKWSLEYTAQVKGISVEDTTITVRAFLNGGGVPDMLGPGYFLVLAGDSVALLEHTSLGPGTGYMSQFQAPHVIPGGGVSDTFLLPETGQIALIDTSGNYIDVVRYGDYISPAPDPFPGNKSAGLIPEWYSLSRYAYAYSTDNTANDFYMAQTPTPLWYSEEAHP